MILAPPLDASFLGLVQGYVLCECPAARKRDAYQRFLGTNKPFVGKLLLPNGAALISEEIFRGELSPKELRDRHSLASVLGIGCDPGVWELYLARIESAVLKDYRRPVTRGSTTALRSCPDCVREDICRFGFSYWRASHQWPALRSCIKHRRALESGCIACAATNNREDWTSRPDSPCVNCGCVEKIRLAVPESTGFAMITQAFDDARWRPWTVQKSVLQPLRSALVRRGLLPNRPSLHELFDFFGLHARQRLVELLGCPSAGLGDVIAVATGRYGGRMPTLHLAMVAYLRWLDAGGRSTIQAVKLRKLPMGAGRLCGRFPA